jgi:hypothetical protein
VADFDKAIGGIRDDWDPIAAFAFAQAIGDIAIVMLNAAAHPVTSLESNLARSARDIKSFLDPFAIEVALKALGRQCEPQAPVRGHSLIKLFDGLSAEIRARIETEWKAIPEPSAPSQLRELLQSHSEDFQKRRYPYEKPGLSAQADLGSVIDAIRRVFLDLLDDAAKARLADLCLAGLTIEDLVAGCAPPPAM